MKSISPNLTGAALVLAITASVYGQDQTSVSTNTPAVAPTAGATNLLASTPAKSFIRLDGTDLIVGDLPPITFHGFASQGYLASSSYSFLAGNTKDGGSFEFSEFGLNASMSPFAHTRVAAQAFMFDVGNVGNYEPVLDYALVDYNFADEFGIRAGRIRRPMGIYNHIQDVDLARVSVLLPQGMYNARWRDFSASIDGGSVYGNVGLSKAGSFSYELYGGVINLSQQGGVARQVENNLVGSGLSLNSVNGNPQVGGQLWWNTPVDGLRAGVALAENFGFTFDASGNFSSPAGPLTVTRHSRFNVPWEQYSLEYQRNKWTFQAEFKQQTLIEKDTTTQTFSAFPAADNTAVSRSVSSSGTWYAGAAYEVNNWLQVGSYYTEYYNDIDHPYSSSLNYQKDLALSFRFDPKPWWIIKVEGHYNHGTALLYDNAHNPTQGNNGWFMLALKSTVSF
jgi:hypothetical protein